MNSLLNNTVVNLNPSSLLILFVFVGVVGIGTTKVAIWLSHWLGILDKPDERKSHGNPVAYLGGLGILLSLGLGLIALVVVEPDLAVFEKERLYWVFAGALGIFLVGFFDDIRPIRAMMKLVLQVLVASGMWAVGIRVDILSFIPFASGALNPLASYVVTVGWYVSLMNAINLVDGLDGLAGGISFIGALSLFGVCLVIAPSTDVVLGGFLSVILAGSVFGFLFFNWHPAKIFMGDSGSLLLGYLLATTSIISSAKTSTVLAMGLPLVALGLPLFEMTFSFLRRILTGSSPFKPDRRHLHHRLLDLGLSQQRVVVALLFLTAFLGINSVIFALAQSKVVLFNVALWLIGLLLLIENLKYLEKNRSTQSGMVATPPDEKV